MLTFLFVMTVIALVLSNASVFVILLLRLAEEHRDITDTRRLAEVHQLRSRHIPAECAPGRGS